MIPVTFKDTVEDFINRFPLTGIGASEGNVYGVKYYTAEPRWGNWPEMEKWARSTYGHPGNLWDNKSPNPHCRWYMNNRKFWFKNEADRTLFLLKWV